MQIDNNILKFHTNKVSRSVTFKEEIISVYTINQYKLLYITRYHYGYINVGSLEILSEKEFPSIVECTCQYRNLFFVLLKSKQLLTISNNIIVNEQKLTFEIIPEFPSITYIEPYLFISSTSSPCYTQLERTNHENATTVFKFPKRVCLEEEDNASIIKYTFNFYQIPTGIKLLFSNTIITKHYLLLLPQVKREGEEARLFSFPYQIVVFVGIALFVVYRKNRQDSSTTGK